MRRVNTSTNMFLGYFLAHKVRGQVFQHFKMRDIIGIFPIAVTFLFAKADGVASNNGYCIGNQCFEVFQYPTDFFAAQNQCQEKKGDLMTVRSSVSHDAISILLGSFIGKYWIGLHLLRGCTNATQLRGFQWVTKDRESDFDNWATLDNRCSPQCVSVSKDNGFKWTQETCSKQAAGFLCEYSFQTPCKPIAVQGGETVSYSTPYGFESEDALSLPPGTTAIGKSTGEKHNCSTQGEWIKVCNRGFQLAKDGRTCKDIDDCANSRECPGNNVRCVNTPGSFKCECKTGYQMTAHGGCALDACVSGPCEQKCNSVSGGGYKCSCFEGYKVNPTNPNMCVLHCDHKECPSICDPNDDNQCECPEGYVKDDLDNGSAFCVDIDECVMYLCDQDCINTYGSYVCHCNKGFVLNADGSNCVKDDVNMSTNPEPLPTNRPSSTLTPGGLLGIILCIVAVVLLTVFLIYHILKRRSKSQAVVSEDEAVGLQHVTEKQHQTDEPLDI